MTSGHSDAQGWASECPDVKNYKWRLNQSGTVCFIVVSIWQQWASKGCGMARLNDHHGCSRPVNITAECHVSETVNTHVACVWDCVWFDCCNSVPPTLIEGLRSSDGVQGTDLHLSCKADGLPAPAFRFYKVYTHRHTHTDRQTDTHRDTDTETQTRLCLTAASLLNLMRSVRWILSLLMAAYIVLHICQSRHNHICVQWHLTAVFLRKIICRLVRPPLDRSILAVSPITLYDLILLWCLIPSPYSYHITHASIVPVWKWLDLDLDSNCQSPDGYFGNGLCTPTGMM